MKWNPPSDRLEKDAQGIWVSRPMTEVSYPQDGNDACFQVEDHSYWFGHRNQCLVTVVKNHPPAGLIYDLGGGNGFVTAAFESAGCGAVLLEPGAGARNGRKRGVERIIQSTVDEAGLESGSMPAAGAFDVIEHIEEEDSFLSKIHEQLEPGGRFYITVPAYPALWSQEDCSAGHYRRYTARTLRRVLEQNGFQVEFVSYLFSWLIVPVFLFRTLPSRFRRSRTEGGTAASSVEVDHTLPPILRWIVGLVHRVEKSRLTNQQVIPFGTSLVCVAKKRDRAG
jgi:SAM-dependent methyltransferase